MAKYLYLSALLSALVALACSSPPYRPNAQYLPGIHDSVLVHGLHYPWDLVWGADGHIWMTERHGRISRVNPVNGKVQLLLEVPGVVARGEGGLLGMALHPSFADTPQLFVACNYLGTKGYAEKIIRYTYDGSGLVDPVVIFDHIEAAYIHNGCRLLILPDRTLLFSTGDAANQSLPQNNESVNGKLLRIHLDGSIPANNPFPNSPVWSYGHRNAQGLVMANGILYSSEHGPDTDDELNILEKGRNYGWPKVHGFCDRGGEKAFCKTNDVLAPIYAWTPTIAVCGLDYYGEGPIQQWRHSLLMATLKDATLYQLQLDSSGRSIQKVDTYLSDKYGRLRDVCVAPNGQVYLCTSNGGNEDKLVVVKAAP